MDIKTKCVEGNCDNDFSISQGEVRFYTDKGYLLPKRCQDCRTRRKKEREDKETKEQ